MRTTKPPCLQLWAWRSGEVKLQLVHRELDRAAWPTLQLNQGEDKAFHGVASAIACHNLEWPNRRFALQMASCDIHACLHACIQAGFRSCGCSAKPDLSLHRLGSRALDAFAAGGAHNGPDQAGGMLCHHLLYTGLPSEALAKAASCRQSNPRADRAWGQTCQFAVLQQVSL